MGTGDLMEAARCLDAAETAIPPVETEQNLQLKAALLRSRAELVESQGGAPGERAALLDEALTLLAAASKVFPWDSAYRGALAAEVEKTVADRLDIEGAAGDPGLAARLEQVTKLAERARTLEFTAMPAEPDAAGQALADYRTTTRHLVNLRGDLYWALGGEGTAKPWKIYYERRDLSWLHRHALASQIVSLRTEMESRIAGVEQLAAEQFAELERLDPETAAVISLDPEALP